MAFGNLRIEFKFLWYDFWIGLYYDQKEHVLYFLPLPCCRFKIWKPRPGERVPWTEHNEAYPSALQQRAVQLVFTERVRQLNKWGSQHHDDPWWLVIETEELGEVARAIFEKGHVLEEATHVTAVGLAWMEDILYSIWGEETTQDGKSDTQDTQGEGPVL